MPPIPLCRETIPHKDNPRLGTEALEKVMEWSTRKKNFARKNRARDVEKDETARL
jgi:hypothetical protein